MDALMREERTLVRRERIAAEARGEGHSRIYRAWTRLQAVFRPLKLLGGILLLLVALLIWASMLITGIDKASNSLCKQRCGYILGHIHVFQPINWIFVRAAAAFPVDYALMALLVLLLFSSSVSGIATIGIRFLWVRLFQIRKGRTPPQALLIATVMLALIILAINYAVAMLVAPQYAIYGTQTFCVNPPRHPGEQPDCSADPDMVRPCSENDNGASHVCTPTVMSTFLNRVTLQWPVFGAIDFWAQFAFLGVFLVVARHHPLPHPAPEPGRDRRGGRGGRRGGPAGEQRTPLRRRVAGHHRPCAAAVAPSGRITELTETALVRGNEPRTTTSAKEAITRRRTGTYTRASCTK